MDTLGQILRKRRKERGFSQKELGVLSGLNDAHISHLERGERFPSGHSLRKLAKPLGFSELGLLRLAGLISQEGVDEVLDKVKQTLKDVVDSFSEKIDIL